MSPPQQQQQGRPRLFLFTLIFILLSIAFFLFSSSSSSSSTTTTSLSISTPSSLVAKHEQEPETTNLPQQQREKHRDSSTCLTYSERYKECKRIRNLPLQKQQELFSNIAKSSSSSKKNKEVVLLRMHKRKWPQDEENNDELVDFWLHVCSFIIESSSKNTRDVVLYTLEGHEKSIPPEFQSLVHTHSEELLHNMYRHPIYSGGGYQRGDLAAHLFLRLHHQYNFAWVMESDLRYVGVSWGDLFSRARKYARETTGTALPSPLNEVYKSQPISKTREELKVKYQNQIEESEIYEKKNGKWPKSFTNPRKSPGYYLPKDYSDYDQEETGFSDSKGDAHLIWFYPPLLNHGYFKFNCSLDQEQPGCSSSTKLKREPFPQWHFSSRAYFVGNWKNLFFEPQNKKWIGAFAPGFGFSRTLAEAIDAEAQIFNSGHVNQEVALPVTAQIYKLKMVPVLNDVLNSQFYFTWLRKNETAPYYFGWMKNKIDFKTMKNQYLLLKEKEEEEEKFDGKDCLSDFLFHPVKF